MDVVLFFILGHLLQVIGSCTLLLAIINISLQLGKKRLSCEILSKGPVAPPGMPILVRGRPVQNLFHFKIKIWNCGARAIKPRNFYRELVFDLGGGVQIEDAYIVRSSYSLPANLPQPGRLGEVKLPNILWNQDDWVELEILFVYNSPPPQNNNIRNPLYSGKIKGGNIIGPPNILLHIMYILFFITSLIAIFNFILYNINTLNIDMVIAIVLFMSIILLNNRRKIVK